MNAALATVKLTTSTDGGPATITLSVSDRGTGSIAYNPTNGHYYQYVNTASTWDAAFNAITGANLTGHLSVVDTATRIAQPVSSCAYTFNGMCGYFATVSTASENAFITNKVGTAAAWLGGSDRRYEGQWKWEDPRAPEYDKQFSNQSNTTPSRTDQTGVSHTGAGTSLTGQALSYVVGGTTYSYVNWNTGEPNNSSNNENALQLLYLKNHH